MTIREDGRSPSGDHPRGFPPLSASVRASKATQATLVLAADQPLVLHGLVSLISGEPDLKILASCGDGEAALKAILEHRPTVALLDCAMPKLSGVKVLTSLSLRDRNELATRVVILGATMEDCDIHAAVVSGALGIVLKEHEPAELFACIRKVAGGDVCFPAGLVEGALRRERGRLEAGGILADKLSSRQCEIALLIGQGLCNKEIARITHLAEGTVKIHLHNIFIKLALSSRKQLLDAANGYKDVLSARSGEYGEVQSSRPTMARASLKVGAYS